MISEKDISQFESDGAICVRGAVAADVVRALLANIDDLIASDDDRWTTNRVGGFSDRHLWPSCPWMRNFCLDSELPKIAAQLMRSNSARLFFDHLFIRDAGTRQTTPWHQDQPYWPFQGEQIASVWLALSPCTYRSSALRFVKGSHRWGKIFAPIPFGEESGSAQFLGGNSAAEPMPDFDANPSEFEILTWDMQPGDALVFGATIVHGAKQNDDATTRRAALSIRYVGDDARWDPRPGTDPIVKAEQTTLKPGEYPADEQWFPLGYQV